MVVTRWLQGQYKILANKLFRMLFSYRQIQDVSQYVVTVELEKPWKCTCAISALLSFRIALLDQNGNLVNKPIENSHFSLISLQLLRALKCNSKGPVYEKWNTI